VSDSVTAKAGESKFKPHNEGQFVAQCVDVIDLGEKVDEGPNFPAKLSQKCALVFRTGEKNPDTGDLTDVAQEYTVSMNEKANLRKALESWRGRPYTESEANKGVPVDKLTGQWALIGVAHKTSAKGRTYAVVQSVVGVPKIMQDKLPIFAEYKRADFWKERKEEYAKEAAKFRALHAGPSGEIDDDGFPDSGLDHEDSLPF